MRRCETPKSPPGDYNFDPSDLLLTPQQIECETPKSPPGDYNGDVTFSFDDAPSWSVKHLNPRQGITTTHIITPHITMHTTMHV